MGFKCDFSSYLHCRTWHDRNLKPKNYVKKEKRKKESYLTWKKKGSKQQNGRRPLIVQKPTCTIRMKE